MAMSGLYRAACRQAMRRAAALRACGAWGDRSLAPDFLAPRRVVMHLGDRMQSLIEPRDTGPVSERHRFDERGLAAWMERHVPGHTGPIEVRQFAGGQSNPTFFVGAGD